MDSVVQKNGKKRFSDKAYDQIWEMIVSLRLKPGEQADEGSLEQYLSIGRTPIREALQRLATDGLMFHVPGRGLFVRSIGIDDVKGLHEAWIALEQIIVQLVAQRIKPHQIKRLEALSQQHKELTSGNDYLKITYSNIAFHRGIWEAADNSFLLQAINGLSHQLVRLHYLSYTEEARPKGGKDHNLLAIDEHERLLECFRTGDSVTAVKIVADHGRRSFIRVCNYMEPRTSLVIPQLCNDFLDNIPDK